MHRIMITLHASILVAAACTSTSRLALADVAMRCETYIKQPQDLQTAISPDIVIQGSSTCVPVAPKFVDDTGTAVPASFVLSNGEFTLTPLELLPPDGTFTVRFDEPPHCTRPPNKITFSTKAKPALRMVDVVIAEGELHALSIRFSEPVKNTSDLGNSSFISVDIEGFSVAGAISPSGSDEAFVTFKPLANRPSSGRSVHVHVAKDLAFASGVALSDDIDVSFIPDEWPVGYYPTGQPEGCDFSSASSGCQVSVGPAPGSLSWVVGMTAGLLLTAWRRRVGWTLRSKQ